MSSLYEAILSMQQDNLITLNSDQMLRIDLDEALDKQDFEKMESLVKALELA
jgi:uncharacterized protein YpiB (UPF0302 family)